MKYITKLKLAAAQQLCDAYDKSTEFTLQYMQDVCKVDLDCVLKYFELPQKEKKKLFEDLNSFTDTMVNIEQTSSMV